MDPKHSYVTNLEEFLSKILSSDSFQNFRPEVKKGSVVGGKNTYRVHHHSAAEWFGAQHLASQLRSEFNSKFSNRNAIAALVADSMTWKFPRVVIRADVHRFYESIPHDVIYELLHQNPAVSTASVRAIRSLLSSFSAVTQLEHGVPRGVSTSASIGEYVLSHFDDAVRSNPDCILYARYVDDIYAVFNREKLDAAKISDLFAVELSKLGLKLSGDATKNYFVDLDAKPSTTPKGFTYLGYKFAFTNNMDQVSLSQRRYSRLKKRIDAAFATFLKSTRSTWEFRILLMRLRFLASNTRLRNNKRSAFVGIRFSQPELTNMQQLDKLTSYIRHRAKAIPDPSLRDRVSTIDLKKGFEDSVYKSWSNEELKLITRIWKRID